MGELLAYSGVSAKLRAMQSRLLTREEYLELGSSKNMMEALEYLGRHPAYQKIFSRYEGQKLHREQIENILQESIGIDFQKIYRFCSVKQREFLDMYFAKYEVKVLKKCLDMIFDHREVSLDLSCFQDFFSHHSRLNLERLSECRNVEELQAAAADTRYGRCISKVKERGGNSPWDYGVALDYEYFVDFWNRRKKYLKGETLEIITQVYGVKMELLDIQWIARGKKYYHMSAHELYALMLPVGTHIHKRELMELTEAATMEEFQKRLSETYYGRHYPEFDLEHMEQLYVKIRQELQHKLVRREPCSIAGIVSYIFDKECEIDRLTSVLECVRYGLDVPSWIIEGGV